MKKQSMILLLALAGCGGSSFSPLFDGTPLEDGGNGGDGATGDAATDAAPSPDAQEADGGLDATAPDADATAPADDAGELVDAGTPDVRHDGGGTHHDAAPPIDAAPPVPCDGAGLSTHHTGTGLTWTDCVAVGTLTTMQALAACDTWCAAQGCTGACFMGHVCDGSFILGQTDTAMLGWADTGETVKVSSSQNSCNHVGSWD